jgi:hypothetical protein
VECDTVYLACAVIACAAYLSEANCNNVTVKLQQATGLPLKDLECLTSIITELILSEE